MQDVEVGKVLDFLDGSWGGKPMFGTEKNPTPARALWGAEISRHGFPEVMQALVDLLRTSEWRPSIAKILAEIHKGRQHAALSEKKRLELAPSPDVPVIPPERLQAIASEVMETTRPSKLENLARTEQRSAAGCTGTRRSWGALALLVLCKDLAAGGERGEVAADVLDDVARRARG